MPKVFKSSFSFGGLAAEKDPLLSAAYWDNGDFETIASPTDPRCFIIGRTGSGKSAAFKHLEELFPNKVIRIVPENLSLSYLTNLNVVNYLLGLDVHLDPFFKALWKHVILVEVLKHRYDINSPEQKKNILERFREIFKNNTGRTMAINYLDEFGDKFWCEADERVKQIAETFENKVAASVGMDAKSFLGNIQGSGSIEKKHTEEVKRELSAKFQRIVNDTQLPRLNEMISILNDEVLDSPTHYTYLVVDDLDKEWADEKIVNLLIRCLFQAVIDMQVVTHLKILVALRTNIFHQLNYGQQTRGGQEEKFRGAALHIRWTESDLEDLLQQRAEVASRHYNLIPPKTLKQMLPNSNKRAGDPIAYILERTLMRPRDAILFLNDCVREATGKGAISWENIHHAELAYSQERLKALRDEWKDPYFDIDKVLDVFRRKPSKLSLQDMASVLDDVAMLLADVKFQGTAWLTSMCDPILSAGEKTWYDMYGQIVDLLYNIAFIGVAKGAHGTPRYSYQDPRLGQGITDIDESTCFVIHLAFRRALDIVEVEREQG